MGVIKGLLSTDVFHKPFDWNNITEWQTNDYYENPDQPQNNLLFRNHLNTLNPHTLSLLSAFVNSASYMKANNSPEFYQNFVMSFLPLFVSFVPYDISLEMMLSFLEQLTTEIHNIPTSEEGKHEIKRQRSRRANPVVAALTTSKISLSGETDVIVIEPETEPVGEREKSVSPKKRPTALSKSIPVKLNLPLHTINTSPDEDSDEDVAN